MKIIFASNNENKVSEIRKLVPNDIELLSLNDMGFTKEIEETKFTLEDNALLKAETIYNWYGMPCFADDSGLEVDVLNGKPGVFSARYAGPQKKDEDNCKKLLEDMKLENNRMAQFRTVIAFKDSENIRFFEGVVKGEILREPKGKNGFGYDPLFMPLHWSLTFAEVDMATKNKISHRALAFHSFLEFLSKK